MELVVEKTGCKLGSVYNIWAFLDSRVIAPPEASIETKMKLLVHDLDLSSPSASELIGKNQARAATVRELLTFLWTYPEEQLKYPVVALGEPPDGNTPIVAYAYMVGNTRMIFIGVPSDTCKWEAGCRFLVVSS